MNKILNAMRRMKSIIMILSVLIWASMSFISCDKEKDDDKKITEMQVTVASVKTFEGVFFYKSSENDEWDWFPLIDNFDHKEGYEYNLLVQKIEPGYTALYSSLACIRGPYYKLLDILSDTEKDSENLPSQTYIVTIGSRKSPAGNFYVRYGYNERWIEMEEVADFDEEYEEGNQYELRYDAYYQGVNADPKYIYEYNHTFTYTDYDSLGLPGDK